LIILLSGLCISSWLNLFNPVIVMDENTNTPLHILIIEDSEDDTELLLRQIRKTGYEPKWQRVETAETMRNALNSESWQVVVSDYSMPRFDGLHALSILQEMELDIPFIIVSAKIGEEIAVQAMKAGANDYIMKDNLSRLMPAIEREMREANLRSQHRIAEEALDKSDERLRLALDATGMGNWEFDVEKREFFWSENISKIFGTESPSITSDYDSYVKFVHPDDRQSIVREVQEFIRDKSESSKYWEHRIIRPDPGLIPTMVPLRITGPCVAPLSISIILAFTGFIRSSLPGIFESPTGLIIAPASKFSFRDPRNDLIYPPMIL